MTPSFESPATPGEIYTICQESKESPAAQACDFCPLLSRIRRRPFSSIVPHTCGTRIDCDGICLSLRFCFSCFSGPFSFFPSAPTAGVPAEGSNKSASGFVRRVPVRLYRHVPPFFKDGPVFFCKKREAENHDDSSSPVLLCFVLMPVHPTKTRFLSDIPGLLHTGAMFSRDELKCSKQSDHKRTAYFSSPYPSGCVRCQFHASAMMCSTSLWTGRQPVTA